MCWDPILIENNFVNGLILFLFVDKPNYYYYYNCFSVYGILYCQNSKKPNKIQEKKNKERKVLPRVSLVSIKITSLRDSWITSSFSVRKGFSTTSSNLHPVYSLPPYFLSKYQACVVDILSVLSLSVFAFLFFV